MNAKYILSGEPFIIHNRPIPYHFIKGKINFGVLVNEIENEKFVVSQISETFFDIGIYVINSYIFKRIFYSDCKILN
jgi:hypothetical protein